MRNSLILDHEQYRKDVWEPLKHFRGRYDSEKIIFETMKELKELQLFQLKEKFEMSNKVWDTSIKTLTKNNLIKVTKESEELWVRLS